MVNQLAVAHEGITTFTATDRTLKPISILIYCPDGLAAGTDVRLSMSTFHSYTVDWQFDGITVEEGTGRVVVGHELPRDWTERVRSGVGPAGGGLIGRPINEVHLCLCQITESLSPGARLRIALRANSSIHTAIAGALLVKTRTPADEHFVQVGQPIPLYNVAGDVTRLEARAKASPDHDGNSQIILFATDDLLNPVPDYEGELALRGQHEEVTLPSQVAVSQADQGRCQLNAKIAQSTASVSRVVRIEVRDEARDLVATSNPILTAPLRERQYFFGAIHFHTRLSVDGDRDPRAAYAYARDLLNLDVIAMTDHAPIGAGWEEALAVNEEFYVPGRFVTLPAWESSNAYGHANLYLRTPESTAGPWHWNPEVNPSEVAWPDDVIMVPHHTNTGQLIARGEHKEAWRQGRYWAKYDWSIPNPRARLVEIVQGRSNFEADALDADWGITMGEQGASVQDALAMGWRLGFVAGTDNHEGHPTQRNGRYVGLTCFRATELTREAIWQAMEQRQTYATSGVPILCDFAVNGLAAGSEGTLSRGEPVHFSTHLHGTAPISIVEIIANGAIVWQQWPGQWDVELTGIELPPPTGEWGYYYLRLRQADGHRAWLSPIWLNYH